LAALKKEGKVRWIGVSNFNKEELEKCSAIAPITSLQPPYNLLKREIEADVYPYCIENKIGVIVYSPMASGLLTGAMSVERAKDLPQDDWRKKNPAFQEPKLSQNLALAEVLRKIGAQRDRTAGEVAVAWTLKNPAVTGAIVGARTAKQVQTSFRADDIVLTDEEMKKIEAAIPS
jgi:aryl-alcohol dehydrogenase-like predicted oxidoreductase